MRNLLSSLTLGAAALAVAGSLAFAHPRHPQPQAQPTPAPQTQPEPPAPPGRNLQVFPDDIPQARLMLVMRSWSQALGVQCSYCHVPGNFRSDANPHKEAARGMMQMTSRINQELLPAIANLHGGAVTCYTCHRGAPQPELVPPEERPGSGAQPSLAPRPPHPEPEDAPHAHIAPDTPAKPH